MATLALKPEQDCIDYTEVAVDKRVVSLGLQTLATDGQGRYVASAVTTAIVNWGEY